MEMPQNIPTLDDLYQSIWAEVRAHRSQLLQQADIKVNQLEDLGEDAGDWRQYRQQLRDLPTTTDNPTKIQWPDKPA